MKNIIKLFVLILLISNVNAENNHTLEIQNFVKRFYIEVLSREFEDTGLKYWSDTLISGENTGADIAKGFIFSDEFKNKGLSNSDYVDVLYIAFFNRTADSDGYSHWVSELENGKSRAFVLDGFIFSDEFKNLAHSYNIKANDNDPLITPVIKSFVQRFYTLILDRNASNQEVESWAFNLSNKSSGAADIAKGFIFSDEFKKRETDDVAFLNIIYKAFFNREPDDKGFSYWIYELEANTSREKIVDGFIYSNEFMELSKSYGISIEATNLNPTSSYILPPTYVVVTPPCREGYLCKNLSVN